jgi:hypothetical protein
VCVYVCERARARVCVCVRARAHTCGVFSWSGRVSDKIGFVTRSFQCRDVRVLGFRFDSVSRKFRFVVKLAPIHPTDKT